MSRVERKYSSRSKNNHKHNDCKRPCKSEGNQSITFPKVSVSIAEPQGCNGGCGGTCGACNGDNVIVVSNLPSDAYPIPGGSETGPIEPCPPKQCGYRYAPINRDCEEATGFKALITQTTGLKALSSSNQGAVQILMRRKNRVVTLQWEP